MLDTVETLVPDSKICITSILIRLSKNTFFEALFVIDPFACSSNHQCAWVQPNRAGRLLVLLTIWNQFSVVISVLLWGACNIISRLWSQIKPSVQHLPCVSLYLPIQQLNLQGFPWRVNLMTQFPWVHSLLTSPAV